MTIKKKGKKERRRKKKQDCWNADIFYFIYKKHTLEKQVSSCNMLTAQLNFSVISSSEVFKHFLLIKQSYVISAHEQISTRYSFWLKMGLK